MVGSQKPQPSSPSRAPEPPPGAFHIALHMRPCRGTCRLRLRSPVPKLCSVFPVSTQIPRFSSTVLLGAFRIDHRSQKQRNTEDRCHALNVSGLHAEPAGRPDSVVVHCDLPPSQDASRQFFVSRQGKDHTIHKAPGTTARATEQPRRPCEVQAATRCALTSLKRSRRDVPRRKKGCKKWIRRHCLFSLVS
jgi:hypothetical protein